MEVRELEGELLNYWVAKANGIKPVWGLSKPVFGDSGPPSRVVFLEAHGGPFVTRWNPVQDWAQGGPILERLLISCDFDGAEGYKWWATTAKSAFSILAHGETYLIAGMRCAVEMSFGEEVPDLDSVHVASTEG